MQIQTNISIDHNPYLAMTRWKASSIHFGISATIGAVIGALLFFLWYPPPYFHAAGADSLMLLLVGVDVVLGPLLTLVVFRKGKKGLKFDLAVIAIAQSIALVYGLSVVLRSRPVFLCGFVDRFSIVSAYQIDPSDLAQAKDEKFSTLSWTGPRLVGARKPTDTNARNKLVTSAVAGRDLDTFPQYFEDYSNVAPDLVKAGKPLSDLRSRSKANSPLLANWLADNKKQDADVLWLPLLAPRDQLIMLIDSHNGRPIQALNINPYSN